VIEFVDDLDGHWQKVERFVEQTFNKVADLQTVLFLVGVQELGRGHQSFSKEQKVDVIHIGICKVLSYSGFYALLSYDSAGWPIWENLAKLPSLDLTTQEVLLKQHVVHYFYENELI
jgi:hypothetical protein